MVDKVWPTAKKDLEKTLAQTKKLIAEGEKHLKEFTEKSVEQTRRVSLGIRREKVYYDLGRLVARTAPAKWKTTKKIIGRP